MNSVNIEVPASAANLGPGFDCLALTIELTNNFEFTLQERGLDIQVQGYDSISLPTDGSNLAAAAFFHLVAQAGLQKPGLLIQSQNKVPVRSGLGSSSTAVVAGLLAANYLLKLEKSREDLLASAADIEGHADNAAAALFGGLVGVHQVDTEWDILQLPLSPLQLVIVVPQVEISTKQMRSVLPRAIPLQQSVSNNASLMALQQALAVADFKRMSQATLDSFHQKARLPHIPGAEQAIAAGRSAGAAVVLAGAGPSLLALAPDNHNEIAGSMQDAFEQVGIMSNRIIAGSRHQGALIHPPI